jgi:hypothetical protein
MNISLDLLSIDMNNELIYILAELHRNEMWPQQGLRNNTGLTQAVDWAVFPIFFCLSDRKDSGEVQREVRYCTSNSTNLIISASTFEHEQD